MKTPEELIAPDADPMLWGLVDEWQCATNIVRVIRARDAEWQAIVDDLRDRLDRKSDYP